MSEETSLQFPELPAIDDRRVFGLPPRLGPAEAVELHRLARTLSETPTNVGFDCGALEALGGAALQVLVALQKDMARAGSSAVLLKVSPAVARTLAQAGLAAGLEAI